MDTRNSAGKRPANNSSTNAGLDRIQPPSRPRVLDQLPKMKLSSTVDLWWNAQRILGEPRKSAQHISARIVVEAIGVEWTRRRTAPPVPGDAFLWPSTEAGGGDRSLDGSLWLKSGVLQFMGYKVGNTNGEVAGMRERIISAVFEAPIPPAFPPAHMDQWGDPGSARRLEKMANTIASFTRNARRRRTAAMDAAIRDWENDLRYLYLNYYVDRFQFDWPPTLVAR